MSLLIILIILFIILLIIVYYLYFLENYIYIKSNLLEEDDIRKLNKELKNIQENNSKYFKDEDYKRYLLLDSTKHKKIYDIIYKNEFLKNKIKKDFNIELKYPKYPIEYRIYKDNIDLIPWHQDKKLMNNYLECIYIVKNNSDSYFQYIKNFKINKYIQNENDLIIVKPNDIIHNITKINDGEKIILKFIINLQ
jgi:hypothetical protein